MCTRNEIALGSLGWLRNELEFQAARGMAEEAVGLDFGKAGKLRRLEPGADIVGLLDQSFQASGRFSGQAEARMDGMGEAGFDLLITIAEHRFEWRDHVADHVFRGVMEQGEQARLRVQPRLDVQAEGFDDNAVLGNGKGVRALGLAVPAGDSSQPMSDILDFDIDRGGIDQIEPTPRQHALPDAGGRGAGGARAAHRHLFTLLQAGVKKRREFGYQLPRFGPV